MLFKRKLSIVLLSFTTLMQISLFEAEEQEKEEIKIESIKAQNISNDEHGNLLLEGQVFIKTNLLDFQTDKASFNQSEGLLELFGNVEVTSSDFKVTSSEIKANLKQQSFAVKQVGIARNDSSFASAQEFLIKTSGDVELKNSSVTNCSIDDPAWEISTRRITYIKEKKNAVIKGIKLKIKNVPIFYLPYLRTAVGNERMSGFLTPSLRQTSQGLDLSLPYYFNLAPNYDLVVTPRYITARGSGAASTFRYLNSSSKGEIHLSGITNDKKYQEETGEDQTRWNVTWKNDLTLGDSFSSFINFQSASDEYFFRDLGNNQFGEARTTYLPRKIGLNWKNSFLKAGLDIKQYQILNPFSFEEYRSMPSLSLHTFLSEGGFSVSLLSNVTRFKSEEIDDLGISKTNIKRTYLIPEMSYKKHFPSSKLAFSFGTNYTKYKLNSHNLSKSSPWLGMEYNIFLDKIKESYTSSLMPTLKYIYSKEEEAKYEYLIDSRISSLTYQNLFRRDRYVGFDRNIKSNKLIIGLQLISNKKNNQTHSSFSIGQAFYLNKQIDYMNPLAKRSRSPFVAEFKTLISNNIWSKGLIEWDDRSSKINSASVGFTYTKDQKRRMELRSVYRRKDLNYSYIPWQDLKTPTNQTELLMQWPFSKSISIFGRLMKDHKFSQSKDILFGFEYSNCCLKLGLMHRKWIEEDYFSWRSDYLTPFEALSQGLNPSKEKNRTYLFFELKKIGRLGKQISKVISSPKLE